MKFVSTTGNTQSRVSLREATMRPVCPDGGLYMPESIPQLPPAFFNNMNEMSLRDIGYVVARSFLSESIEASDIKDMVDHTLSFDMPLVKLDSQLYVMELFNGPSATFKDVATRFISSAYKRDIALGRFNARKPIALLATAGDSGAAMAIGMREVKGADIIILFPQGKINHIQREQLATAGNSVTAVEVRGSFDQCQRMVVEALSDPEINLGAEITSLNSLNILRLLPQMFHYFHAVASVMRKNPKAAAVSFALPGGNLGNLTAGIIAKRMGLPVQHFFVGVNANSPLPEYLASGVFRQHMPVSTIAGAIDVVNPANFKRMECLYHGDHKLMAEDISAAVCESTEAIFGNMADCHKRYGYLTDPHTATAYAAAKNMRHDDGVTVILATSHPAKSPEAVFNATGVYPVTPPSIASLGDKRGRVIKISPRYPALRNLILNDILANS